MELMHINQSRARVPDCYSYEAGGRVEGILVSQTENTVYCVINVGGMIVI